MLVNKSQNNQPDVPLVSYKQIPHNKIALTSQWTCTGTVHASFRIKMVNDQYGSKNANSTITKDDNKGVKWVTKAGLVWSGLLQTVESEPLSCSACNNHEIVEGQVFEGYFSLYLYSPSSFTFLFNFSSSHAQPVLPLLIPLSVHDRRLG